MNYKKYFVPMLMLHDGCSIAILQVRSILIDFVLRFLPIINNSTVFEISNTIIIQVCLRIY